MATVQANTTTSAPRSDMKLAVLIAVATLVCLLAARAYTQVASAEAAPQRPVPFWLTVSPISAQTMDGRRLSIKISLEAKNKTDLETLGHYEAAFKFLVAEVSLGFKLDEYQGSERIVQFGDKVAGSINNYLKEQHVSARIKRVTFEEFRLIPS